MASMDPEEEALIAYADNSVYKKNRTAYADRSWTWAYLLTLAACVLGAVFAWFNKSIDFQQVGPDFLSNPDNCPVTEHGRFLREQDGKSEFDVNEFWHVAKCWLCSTVLASMAIGVLFLYCFQKMAVAMVWTSMALLEVSFIAGAAAVLSGGAKHAAVGGAILVALAVIWPLMVYRWRSRLVLCGQLLCVASKALSANPLLIPTTIGLSLAFIVAEVPLYAAGILSLSNGTLVRTAGAMPHASQENQLGCVDPYGQPTMCCTWQPDSWLLAYWPVLALAIVWTWSVGSQLRAYTVSGCAAQWYFMTPAVSSMRSPSTKGFISRALGHGLTTSFGSLCFSGLVLPIVKMIKSLISRSHSSSSSSAVVLVSFILRCIVSAFLDVILAITQFATVAMAITGEPFIASGRAVTALLGRHLLSSVGVWTFPPMILGMVSFMLALVWACIVYTVSAVSWASHPQGHWDALVLAGIVFFTSSMVLSFYQGVLLNVVDACYICYAMDLDNRAVTHQEVHDIYSAIPSGKLVVQPDEELAYGSAADAPQHAAPSNGLTIQRPLIPVTMDDPVPAPAHYPVSQAPKS